jgi:hypothetical protein
MSPRYIPYDLEWCLNISFAKSVRWKVDKRDVDQFQK